MTMRLAEEPPLSPKQSAIIKFLGEKGFICPFATVSARNNDIIFAEVAPNEDPHETIFEGIKEFAQEEKRALIVVCEHDYLDHSKAKEQAIDIFIELLVANERLFVSPKKDDLRHISERRAYWSSQKLPELTSDDPKRRPILDIGAELVFTVAMGPAYKITDPRYAPHSIVVVTWQIDVVLAEAHSREIVKVMRNRLRAVVGKYDGTQLYIVR